MEKVKTENKIESPNELLELATGYQRSQVLFTLVELEIPKILNKENLNAADISRKLDIHPLAMERFLNACVTVGLLERKNEIYKNAPLTDYFLVKGNQFYLGGQIKRYQNRSYPLWNDFGSALFVRPDKIDLS